MIAAALQALLENLKDREGRHLKEYQDVPKIRCSIEEKINKSFIQAVAEYGVKEVSAGRDMVFDYKTSKYEFILNIDLQALAASSFSAVENYKSYLSKKLGRLYFTPERAGASDMRAGGRPRAGLGDIYVDIKTFAPDREHLERRKEIRQREDDEPVPGEFRILSGCVLKYCVLKFFFSIR
jgi:hypothetical protein